MSTNDSKVQTKYCPKCKKDVPVTVRMWNTVICTICNTIISSDKGIDKVNI